jgi:ligand-binding SRPBCC domain-containing protein
VAADDYRHRTSLWLPEPRARVFDFFADAHNLERITPPFLRFHVLTPAPIAMARGARIDYRLRLHGVPLRWETAITDWEPPRRFRDEQRRGPYAQWLHTHTFEEEDGGTMVRDEVRYRLRGPSALARVINRVMVAPDTRAIFEYRRQALTRIFAAQRVDRLGPVVLERLTPPEASSSA